MTKTSKIALMAMVLLLTLLSPRLANAYCVYNAKNSDRTVTIAQIQKGEQFRNNYGDLQAFQSTSGRFFAATLKPGGKSCCNWREKDCNSGGRNHSLIFAAVDQDVQPKMLGSGTDEEVWRAEMCQGIIPAGGALVVTAKGGGISCKAGSKYGQGLGYYHPLNNLAWKMRRPLSDRMSGRKRVDKVDWNNVFDGGKLADGSKQGVCRGYLTPGDRSLQMKFVKAMQGKKLSPKNSKGLVLGRLENDICIAELFGGELRFGVFEYLVRGTRAKWVKSDGKRAGSRTAMYAGVDWTTKLLNICRAKYKGGVHPGKQYGDQCYIAVDGKGFGVRAPFEVLVKR